jgi:hypothetical protein
MKHIDALEAHYTAIVLALEHGLDAIRAELVPSRNAVPLRGAEYRSLYANAGAGVRVMAAGGRLAGYSVRETTGAAPAVIRLRDGADVAGDLVATIALTQGQSLTAWLMPTGISLTYGLFAEVVTGAIEGVAYLNQA